MWIDLSKWYYSHSFFAVADACRDPDSDFRRVANPTELSKLLNIKPLRGGFSSVRPGLVTPRAQGE